MLHKIDYLIVMKSTKVIYWISTGLFSAYMMMSAFLYITKPEMKGAFAGLGFTEDYFRIELAIAKFLGAIVLIVPMIPKVLKGFAYAGFTINIVSALIAHVAMSYHSYGLLIFSVITLAVSYYTSLQLEKKDTINVI